jgi:hypothetical protein
MRAGQPSLTDERSIMVTSCTPELKSVFSHNLVKIYHNIHFSTITNCQNIKKTSSTVHMHGKESSRIYPSWDTWNTWNT